MELRIHFDGLGPIKLGMRADEVQAIFDEPRAWSSWMGGNLNDAFVFPGLIFQFNGGDAVKPLPDAQLDRIWVKGSDRDDVTLFGRPVTAWTRADVLNRARRKGYTVEGAADRTVSVGTSLSLIFDDEDRLSDVQIDRPSSTEWFVEQHNH